MPQRDEILSFARVSLGSVWALEVLLLLRRTVARDWTTPSLVAELRSSPAAVDGALDRLRQAGLVVTDTGGVHRFQPIAPPLEALVADLAELYAGHPVTVINAIISPPDSSIRSFADAFRIKKD